MTPVRALAVGGLLSAALTTVGGLADAPALIGVAGAVMLAANVFALVKR